MISARRAALLGLKVPLSAIMLAVLGLWPEPEDEPSHGGGGGGGGRQRRWLAEGVRLPMLPAMEDDDAQQVRESWQAIEEVRERDAKRDQSVSVAQGSEGGAAPSSEVGAIVGAAGAAEPPPIVVVQQPQAIAVDLAAARRRANNDLALALILAECA